MMKSTALFLFVLAIFIPAILTAQLNHFIYLQTEGKQPFYVKLDKKILSSSSSGYLIIPRLIEGAYNITVGFPKQENNEQAYTCNVSKDAGYLIKNFGEKGWGLFNMQTLDIVMAGAAVKEITVAKVEKTDEFSNMLSQVVNDPSIKQVEKPIAPVKETVVAAKQGDKAQVPQSNKSSIIKKQVVTTKAGIEAIYIDITGDRPDTIKLFIPADKATEEAAVQPIPEQPEKIKQEETFVEVKQAEHKEDIKEDAQSIKEESKEKSKKEKKADAKLLPNEIKATGMPNTEASLASSNQMVNSNCKAIATEEDFLKLRKKMAAEDTDDGMIAVGQKFLKAKCYSTEQIKNLSFLFLKDEGKYRFFDTAYPFVSDSPNFNTLENQLFDTYYISRFKAMVRH